MRPRVLGTLFARVRSGEGGFARWVLGHWPPALAVFAVALAARCHRLGEESLWIDEAISFARARLPLQILIDDCIRRKHVPTYFLLLKGMMHFGDSEAMLRFPSALFGAATALLGYGLGAVLHGRIAGLVTGLLIAAAGLQVHYGQEARMYTLLTMSTTLAMVGLSWLARTPAIAAASPRALLSAERRPAQPQLERAQARGALAAWLAVWAGTVLALYSHNTAAFFVATLNVAAFLVWTVIPGHRAGFARNWLICMGAALALFAFWLPTLLRQTEQVRRAWKGHDPTDEWVGSVLRDIYLLGDSRLFAMLLLGSGLWALWSLRGRARLGLAALALAFVGPALLFGVALVVPIFYRRIILWAGPPWFALVGVGIGSLPRPLAAVALLALLAFLPSQLQNYYKDEQKPGWRPLIQELSARTDESSVILGAGAGRFLDYYFNRNTDPIPARSVKNVRDRVPFESYVGDAQTFFVIAQPHDRSYQLLRARIAQSNRYKVVERDRRGSALLLHYRRKR